MDGQAPEFGGGTTVPVPQPAIGAEDHREEVTLVDEAFVGFADEASQAEARAMALDREGRTEFAIEAYRQAAELLMQAASACPEERSDRATLAKHAGEVMGRVIYLQSLNGAPAIAPVEEHIGCAQVSYDDRAAPGVSAFSAAEPDDDYVCVDRADACVPEKKPGRVKQALSAAAVGGATGLLVMHGPISAVALAAGAAYATTRNDAAGEAAREIGTAGLKVVSRAKTFDKEHRVSEHVSGKVTQALSKAKEMDGRYGVIDRTHAVAASSWETLSDLERKHSVKKRVGKGVAIAAGGVMTASSKIAGWLSKPKETKPPSLG